MKRVVKMIAIILVFSLLFYSPSMNSSVYAAATNDYTQWKQGDAEWNKSQAWPKSEYPGATAYYMKDAGCVVTSVAMLLRHFNVVTDSNVNNFNPWICNNKLKSVGAFNSAADLIWGSVSKAYPGMVYAGTQGYSLSNLKNLYNQGYACIIQARSGHFVALRSINGDNVTIMDPGYNRTSLSSYASPISIFYYKMSGSVNPTPSSTLTASYSPNGISLSWGAVSGAAGYWLKRSTSANGTYTLVTETSRLSHIDPYVDPGAKYYYKVQPFNSNRQGMDHTNIVSYIANCKLTYSSNGASAVGLMWSKSADASGYWVKRSTSENGTYATCSETTSTSYTDINVEAGEKYYYKVQPFNSKRQGMNHSNIICVEIGEFVPPAITDISVSGQNVTVKWNAAKGATKYNIQLCNSDWTKSWWYSTTETSYTFQNLTDGVWQFRVGSEDNKGNLANAQSYRYISLGTPGTAELTNPVVEDNKVTLGWSSVANCTYIEVVIYNSHEESAYTSARNPLVLENLDAGTYTYKVYTYNTKGDYRQSKEGTFTINAKECSHIWDGGRITKAATCISKGIKTYTCISCEATKTEEIAVNSDNHTGNTSVRNAKTATCGKSGYTGDTYCSDCNALLQSGTTIKATGNHTWNNGAVVREATETTEGLMRYTCTVCSATKDERIPALSHTHTWNQGVITSDPTCISKGIKTFTCTSCKTTKTEEIGIDANNHIGNTFVKNAKAAICGEDGYTGDTHCVSCGEIVKSGTTTKATGNHVWDNGNVKENATCAKKGVKVYTCTVCNTTKTEEIAEIGHNYSTEYTIDKKAAVDQEGSKSKHCTSCSSTTAVIKMPRISSYVIYAGKTATLPTNAKASSWTTSNKKVVTVTAKGVIKGIKAGSATITATISGKKYTCKVTVKNCSIAVNKTKLTMKKGQTYQLTAKATPEAKVAWSSSKKSVATVSSTGFITAKKKGKCTITAKANGVTKKITITVK